MSRAAKFAMIGVVGAGSYGAALALAATRAGCTVRLWARDPETVAAIARSRRAPRLPEVELPETIAATATLATLADCDALIVAVPTQGLRSACLNLAGQLPGGIPVVSAAKGIEQASGLFPTEIITSVLPGTRTAILSGPSFAIDIGRGLPTAVTLAAGEPELARSLAEALSSPAFRIYHSDDPRGVEIGGAAKNVLAIAAGIAIGLGYGESARAALVARGFAELRRFGAAYGGEAETLMGLSGLGDVVLSCASPQSRNFAYGLALGQGRSPAEAAGGKLAEGAFTAPILVEMARSRQVETPIAEAVAKISAGHICVAEAVAALLARQIKAER